MMEILSNIAPEKNSTELFKHFSDTYFALRTGLALLAFTMPLTLYLVGKFIYGLDLQASMSAYFWAAGEHQCATFPMRTFFVGYLFAIGVGLYVYKGFTPLENTLLNISAICAACVAIFPERISIDDHHLEPLFNNCPAVKEWAMHPTLPIHYIAAVVLFVFLAIVVWTCAKKSLKYLPPGHDPAKFIRAYKIIAIAMLVFPILGLAIAFVLGASSDKIFFIEAAGVWSFGSYWIVKSYELSLSRIEQNPDEALEYAKQRGDIEP
jgi:phosphoglycerol transferase MdoB-like AlkP superfamily enzyme